MTTNITRPPEVSVIIPIFNTVQYVEPCVHSILHQSFANFELILVDDGSTDGSEAVCDRLAASDRRIRVLHRPNGGRSRARNAGLEAAQGMFVTFVDSDDRLTCDALQHLLFAARRHRADIAVCRHRVTTPEGQTQQIVGLEHEGTLSGTEALRLILHDEKLKNYAWGKLFRRELLTGIRFPEGRVFEDVATVYRWFARAQRVALTPYVGYEYLKNPSGIVMAAKGSRKWVAGTVDNILAWTERYQFCKQHATVSADAAFCAVHTLLMILRFEERCLRYDIEPSITQIVTLMNCRNSFETADLSRMMPKQAIDVAWAKAKLRGIWSTKRLQLALWAMFRLVHAPHLDV